MSTNQAFVLIDDEENPLQIEPENNPIIQTEDSITIRNLDFDTTEESSSGDLWQIVCAKTEARALFINFCLLRELPLSIFHAPFASTLKKLDLTDNQLRTLPDLIDKFVSLESLTLDHNELHDLPESISSLKHLRVLSLEDNSVTYLPRAINSCENLEWLIIEDNPLDKPSFPDSLLTNQKLVILYETRKAHLIAPRLYLSGREPAGDIHFLLENKITHILCLDGYPKFPKKFHYKALDIIDSQDQQIMDLFEEANLFIHTGRKNGNVLIHCAAGMSRSASFCIAYLMAAEKLSLEEAWQHTRKSRYCISPNRGFWSQLEQYEDTLKNPSRVSPVQRQYESMQRSE